MQTSRLSGDGEENCWDGLNLFVYSVSDFYHEGTKSTKDTKFPRQFKTFFYRKDAEHSEVRELKKMNEMIPRQPVTQESHGFVNQLNSSLRNSETSASLR